MSAPDRVVPARAKQRDPLARSLSGRLSSARSRLRHAALAAIPLTLLAACSAEVARAPDYDVLAKAIVYGEDDRVDLYQADELFAEIARNTAIAFIGPSQMRLLNDGNYAIDAPRYGDLQSLCPGERFADQPAAASCSGVLLGPDIVATSGHCLGVAPDGGPDCTNNLYVLGFGITDPSIPITIPTDNVFECKQVLGRVKAPPESPCSFDFALLELDREVAAATPASIRSRPVQQGESVVVIGFTAGLPVKIDRGAQVIDARSEEGDFFTLNSDTFAVSSGSGVFDTEGYLVGLFSRGRLDYDQDGTCQRVHREAQVGAPAYEEATHIAAVQQLLSAVRRVERPEPLEEGQEACTASDYAEIEPRAASNKTDTSLSAGARSSSACAIAGIGIRARRGGGSVSILVVALIEAFRRIRGRASAMRRCNCDRTSFDAFIVKHGLAFR